MIYNEDLSKIPVGKGVLMTRKIGNRIKVCNALLVQNDQQVKLISDSGMVFRFKATDYNRKWWIEAVN